MEAIKKKHTGVYLPPDLLKRLAQFQVDKAGGLYGRNEIIIRAIDEFLKRNKHCKSTAPPLTPIKSGAETSTRG